MKLTLVLSLLAFSMASSAFAMGITRSREVPVTNVTISSSVQLKDLDGNMISMKDIHINSFHTAFSGFPKTEYYLDFAAKSSTGADVAFRFYLPSKVELDSDNYPIFTVPTVPASVTQQSIGLWVNLSSPGNWSAPVVTKDYEPCQRPEQEFVCTDGPRGYCGWTTVYVTGEQLVQRTTSTKVDGYTIGLTDGTAPDASMNYSHEYVNIDEEPLSGCF